MTAGTLARDVADAPALPVARPLWESAVASALAVVDALAIVVATLIALRWGPEGTVLVGADGVPRLVTYGVIAAVPPLWVGLLASGAAYDPRHLGAGLQEFQHLVVGSLRFAVALALVAYALQDSLSREFTLVVLPTGFVLLSLGRVAGRWVLHRLRRSGRCLHRVLVIGTVGDIERLVHRFDVARHTGLLVVAAALPDRSAHPALEVGGRLLPVLDGSSDLGSSLHALNIDTVTVAGADALPSESLREWSWQLESAGVGLLEAPIISRSAVRRLYARAARPTAPAREVPQDNAMPVAQPTATGTDRPAPAAVPHPVAAEPPTPLAKPVSAQPQTPDDLIEALRAENEALQIRVSQLDAAAAEYRRQMAEVLTSVSWRTTAPVRNAAGKVRLAKAKARAIPRRVVERSRPVVSPTTGLFHPRADPLLTLDSPLLNRPLGKGPFNLPPPRPREPGSPTVLVVAHVFYPEVWPDIEDRLTRIPEAYDLLVTLVEGRAESLEPEINRRLPHARIVHVKNRGRDLGPLVELANLGLFDGYDAILKVHTKRSPHRLDGDAWRVTLLDGVLPSPEGVRRIIELLRRDPDVGIVCPTGHVKGPETWGSDQVLVEALAARMPFAFDPDSLRYPAGSMYWARPWVLQRLADLQLTEEHFESEADHLDGSTAHALERYIGVSAMASGLDVLETDAVPSRLHRARALPATNPRVLAFYLPQYHRTPENDQWWGEGFTDWVNVDKAQPLFEGHRQPLVPGELGRYDLTDTSVMAAQSALAREHGLAGFVMYHYWFDGRSVLDAPLNNLLADPTVDFPFALCWANESWTRSWDGLEKDVLIEQTYTAGWADRYYDEIRPALLDPRYIRVDGKPLLVVYRAGHLPKGGDAVRRWKQRAEEDGLGGLHVLGVVPSRDFEALPSNVAGALDGLVRFPPGSGIGLHSLRGLLGDAADELTGDTYSYDAAVDGADMSTSGPHGLRIHPGVMPGWDNTARRGTGAYAFHGSNPLSFRRWLGMASAAAHGAPDPLVFVNAWNEWAEGAVLEPASRFGRGNLEPVRDMSGQAS